MNIKHQLLVMISAYNAVDVIWLVQILGIKLFNSMVMVLYQESSKKIAQVVLFATQFVQ